MDSGKDNSTSLPLAGIGNAAEWLWRAADLKNLRSSFGSGDEFGQTGAEKEIAAQAVAFVVNSSRKGIVALCADVANLLRARRSLEEKLMAREGEVISPLAGDAAAPYGSWTTCSHSSSSSSSGTVAVVAAAASATTSATVDGCSPSCKHHRISRASSSNSGGSGSGCRCRPGCCTKDLAPPAATAGAIAEATKEYAARDECNVTQCRGGRDRPLLCRQASFEVSSDYSTGVSRIDSRNALTRCDVTLSESADRPKDAACRPDSGSVCLADESSSTPVLRSQSGDVLQTSAGRCDGDGQPADVACSGGSDCCCRCLSELGSHLPDGGASLGRPCDSCSTSEDEAFTSSSSSPQRKSRGVQVSTPALNSVAMRCSSCRACEDRLCDAMQANRKLMTQLAATQRELICLQEKLSRYSNGLKIQVRPSSQNGQNMPTDTNMPAGKTLPLYPSIVAIESSRSASHSRNTSQLSDDAVQPVVVPAASDPRDRSPMSACSPTSEHQNGRLLSSPKSKAGGRRTALSESCTADSAVGSSGDSHSPAVAAGSQASAALGALGKLRRLIKGASVGGSVLLTESRSKTVKLSDEVVTTLDQRGIVRYIGSLHDAPQEPSTVYVGLQLREPVGTNDGTYEGRRFFSCEQNHGLFVALHDIKSIVKKKKLVQNLPSGGSSDTGSSRSEDLATAAAVGSLGTSNSSSARLPQARTASTAAPSAGSSLKSTAVSYERRATLPTLHKWSASMSGHRRQSDVENSSTV